MPSMSPPPVTSICFNCWRQTQCSLSFCGYTFDWELQFTDNRTVPLFWSGFFSKVFKTSWTRSSLQWCQKMCWGERASWESGKQNLLKCTLSWVFDLSNIGTHIWRTPGNVEICLCILSPLLDVVSLKCNCAGCHFNLTKLGRSYQEEYKRRNYKSGNCTMSVIFSYV